MIGLIVIFDEVMNVLILALLVLAVFSLGMTIMHRSNECLFAALCLMCMSNICVAFSLSSFFHSSLLTRRQTKAGNF